MSTVSGQSIVHLPYVQSGSHGLWTDPCTPKLHPYMDLAVAMSLTCMTTRNGGYIFYNFAFFDRKQIMHASTVSLQLKRISRTWEKSPNFAVYVGE